MDHQAFCKHLVSRDTHRGFEANLPPKASSVNHQLCGLGALTPPLWASACLSTAWGGHNKPRFVQNQRGFFLAVCTEKPPRECQSGKELSRQIGEMQGDQ